MQRDNVSKNRRAKIFSEIQYTAVEDSVLIIGSMKTFFNFFNTYEAR